MGSEGPPAVTIHVTGFKKFHGVAENPTETIVGNLKEFLEKKGFPEGFILGSCNILETAGQGALASLHQTLESAVTSSDYSSLNSKPIIWVHFGVNSGATRFAIESQAVNEATFRCPDELGWKPLNVPIVSADGDIKRVRETTLPLDEITSTLAKMGYNVTRSDDAGRFVCNYVYYHSLRFAEENGIKSLFVHVPLFLTINEEIQMQFAASLLGVLASLCDVQWVIFASMFGRQVKDCISCYAQDWSWYASENLGRKNAQKCNSYFQHLLMGEEPKGGIVRSF